MSPARFTEFAQMASDGFLQDSVSLNDGISKVAQEHDLTPGQIGQVCQQANVLTYQELFKTADDKTFQFPLADSKAVIASISKVEEPGVPANELIDYLTDPPVQKKAQSQADYYRIFGVEEISNEDLVQEKVAQAGKIRENIEAAKAEIERRIIDNNHDIEVSREKVAHEMRQVILTDDDGREAALMKVAEVVIHGVKKDKVGIALVEIHKIASAFAQEGLFGVANQGKDLEFRMDAGITKNHFGEIVKTGERTFAFNFIEKTAEKTQEDLISKTQFTGSPAPMDKVRIVNGNHPMIMEISTLVNQVSQEDRLKQGLQLLEDKANYVVKKISDINTTKQTDKYVQDETGDKPSVPDEPITTNLRRFNAGVY